MAEPAEQQIADDRHRRSVMVVSADDGFAARVDDLLNAADVAVRIERVDGYLLALGAIGSPRQNDRPGASHPPDVLMGRVDDSNGSARSTASGLRRLAPGIRLLLVTDPEREEEAIQALAAGFDRYLIEPVTAEDVAEAIRADADAGDTLPETDADLEIAPPAATADTAADVIGDVDLIHHLLTSVKPLEPLALRLVREQSGHASIEFVQREDQAPPGHGSALVEGHGRKFGRLHAPAPVTAEMLGPWAGWMGRWLAMEHRMRALADMAHRDELTGVWNRRYFNEFLERIIDRATRERFRITLLVFDIDNFKLYNDRYGHGAGDEILRETARLMTSVMREHDVVSRIGGDEFAVIFWDAEGRRKPNSEHPKSVRRVARRFQQAVCAHMFPKLAEQAKGTLTISGGLAGFPWDGRTPEALLEKADQMAIQSKRQGKNVITLGPGAAQACDHLSLDDQLH